MAQQMMTDRIDDSPESVAQRVLALPPERLASCTVLPPDDEDGVDAWRVLRAVASGEAAEYAGMKLRVSWDDILVRQSRTIMIR